MCRIEYGARILLAHDMKGMLPEHAAIRGNTNEWASESHGVSGGVYLGLYNDNYGLIGVVSIRDISTAFDDEAIAATRTDSAA